MPCSACKRDKEVSARGLCAACYQRWRKTGTTEYQRWGKRNVCSVGGCKSFVVSHGLCDKHRIRMRDHGSTDDPRPDSWGARSKHPLTHTWKWLSRHRGARPIAKEWENDFLQFIADVGERPSTKHKLFAADESKPIGPDNFVWKRAVTEKVSGESDKTYYARAQRVYRKVRKEAYVEYDLKRRFGVSYEQYQRMHKVQLGRCAICAKKESTVIRGKVIGLAVDHCHDSGKIRGLLCRKCNQGIGHFDHDVRLLRAAIIYLK